ncbi:hypothetical protein LSM04_005260 [Trypanosoma melophagium]|uniref:uncharacterized protein n=1 Tax=Trypanosoma melophagium TaxID=715481 RepID=UPI00351A2995|nr:hypothetical protein LSM04_005260 [Trypanosoma melophagium]
MTEHYQQKECDSCIYFVESGFTLVDSAHRLPHPTNTNTINADNTSSSVLSGTINTTPEDPLKRKNKDEHKRKRKKGTSEERRKDGNEKKVRKHNGIGEKKKRHNIHEDGVFEANYDHFAAFMKPSEQQMDKSDTTEGGSNKSNSNRHSPLLEPTTLETITVPELKVKESIGGEKEHSDTSILGVFTLNGNVEPNNSNNNKLVEEVRGDVLLAVNHHTDESSISPAVSGAVEVESSQDHNINNNNNNNKHPTGETGNTKRETGEVLETTIYQKLKSRVSSNSQPSISMRSATAARAKPALTPYTSSYSYALQANGGHILSTYPLQRPTSEHTNETTGSPETKHYWQEVYYENFGRKSEPRSKKRTPTDIYTRTITA